MASHTLAIAKASLAASMMRPDPTALPRSEVAQFHQHIETLLEQCSSTNIQLCKDWLLKNITHSKTRAAALGKFFAAACVSFGGPEQKQTKAPKDAGAPPQRKQLHVLYLLSDLLHHVEYHVESTTAKATLMECLHSPLLDIIQGASSHSLANYPAHHAKIQDLLDFWGNQGLFPSTYLQRLRGVTIDAAQGQKAVEDEANEMPGGFGQIRKDAPYIMPSSHGDTSTPFYDLPAGNMMPLIIPNSTAPINPQSMKPLKFVNGPAEAKLAATVQDFLKRVDTLEAVEFADNLDSEYDVDELGQSILRDPTTGEIMEGDGYYGWSRGFCERMKNGASGTKGWFGNDMSHNGSLEGSQSPRKRRRYSSSRSYSSDDRDRLKSRSRSRSAERRRHQSTPRPRTESYSPPAMIPSPHQPLSTNPGQQPPQTGTQIPAPPPPPPFTQGFPIGPGGVPIPPRPPNYNGPWPPPPPPPPPSGPSSAPPFSFGPQRNQMFQNRSGWPQQHQPSAPDPASPYQTPSQGSPHVPGRVDAPTGLGRGYGRGNWSR